MVAAVGEEYPASSLVAVHSTLPRAASKATRPAPFGPPALTKTALPSTRGEAAGPKKLLANAEFRMRVHSPYLSAGSQIDRVENALRAERVDAPARDRRRSSRAFVEAEVIAIGGGVFEDPEPLPGGGFHTFHRPFAVHAMEQNQLAARDNGCAESRTYVLLPHKLRIAERGSRKLRARYEPLRCRPGNCGQSAADAAKLSAIRAMGRHRDNM